jgi:hypothetical protein
MGSHAITYALAALAIAVVSLVAGFAWGRSNVKAQIEEAVEKEHVALDAREFSMRTQLEDAIAELAKLRPAAEELGRVQKRLEREQSRYAQMRAEFNSSMGIGSDASAEENSDFDAQPVAPNESADEAIQKLMQSLEVFNDPNAEVPAPSPAPEPPAPKPIVPTVSVAQAQPPARPAPAPPAPRPAELPKAAKPPQPLAPTPASIQPQPLRSTPPPVSPKAEPVKPSQNVPSKSAPAATNAPSRPAAPAASAPPKPPASMPTKPGQHVDEWQKFARELEALTGKKK